MIAESILNNKKIILDNFNKGKFEKVIKLGKKFLKKNLQTLQLVLTSYQILNIKFFKIILQNFKNVLWTTGNNGLS